ncbi:response regulator [Exiguobacterium sp. SL14]|nr:response regulator [Exiguobacterium sp. SL14]MCY1691807.1 response regulator [Exiguobacterium sp. SL14]
MSILVVDDELTNLMLLERLLENEGYDVVKAMSGEEAIELMEDPLFIEQLDVVLLDVEMLGDQRNRSNTFDSKTVWS